MRRLLLLLCVFAVSLHAQQPLVLAPPTVAPVVSQDGSPVAVPFAPSPSGGVPYTVTCFPPSDSLFPVGDTSVSCLVVDSVGNTAATTFTVPVTYTPPPPPSPPNTTCDFTEMPTYGPWVQIGQIPAGTMEVSSAICVGTEIWAANRTNGVQRSTDGGVSWTAQNAGLVVGTDNAKVLIRRQSTGTVFLALSNGVPGVKKWNGTQWVAVAGLTGYGYDFVDLGTELLVSAREASSGYIRVYSTTDENTFVKVGNPTPPIQLGGKMGCGPVDCWIGSEGAGTFRSTDHMRTWLQVCSGCSGVSGYAFLNGEVIEFLRSFTRRWDGVTFTTLPNNGGMFYGGTGNQDTVFSTLQFSNRVYVGTAHAQTGVYVTTTGLTFTPQQEASWSATRTGNARVMGLLALGQNLIPITGDGRVFRALGQ